MFQKMLQVGSGGGGEESKFVEGTFNYTVATKSTIDCGFKPKKVIAFVRHTSTDVRGMLVYKDGDEPTVLDYYKGSTFTYHKYDSSYGDFFTLTDNGFEVYTSNNSFPTSTVSYFAFG